MKKATAILAAAMLSVVLTACGGSSDKNSTSGDKSSASGDYCKELKSASNDFSSLGSNDLSQLDNAFTALHKLAGEAPADIKADWKILDGAITTIQDGFADAGIKPEDFAKIQAGQLPKGVDVAKLQELGTKFGELTAEKFTKASENIATHAKEVCKVDLK